jgi:Ca2+-binding EF-hand superfamily protein
MFSVFDRNASGEVDFGEFCTALTAFCTFTRASLAGLAFHLLDSNNSGSIDAVEVMELIRELADDPHFSIDAKELLSDVARSVRSINTEAVSQASSVSVEGGGDSREETKKESTTETTTTTPPTKIKITEKMFLAFALKNPAVTLPALRLQQQLREAIGGEPFWEETSLRRAKKAEEKAAAQEVNETIKAPRGMSHYEEIARSKRFAANAESSFHLARHAGNMNSASIHPDSLVGALKLISSGSVTADDIDEVNAEEAHHNYTVIVGNISAARIAHALVAGLDSVVKLRAGKYASSRKKNPPEIRKTVARQNRRLAASDAARSAKEREIAAKLEKQMSGSTLDPSEPTESSSSEHKVNHETRTRPTDRIEAE